MPCLPANAKSVAPDLLADDFESAAKLLNSIVEPIQQQGGLDFGGRSTNKMVYTNGVTLWMLILQRLGRGKTLEEIVSHVIAHGRDVFPDNKRVREQSLSENSGAYARARKRLPVDFIFDFSNLICNYLGEISEPFADGQRAFILDGTTITLPPTPALKAAYPPAPNQHGESVWPVARLMVANELQSGCALLPQIDPMYGENNASEAVQARRILKQLPARSIVMADSGFGIYSVAHHAVLAGHNFLFRLSGQRFKALRRRAVLIDEGPTHKTFHLLWPPSDKDRQSTPDLPADASLDVVLHEVDIQSDKPLYLVSNLEWNGPTAATGYRRRYDVEFDIRDFKVTLDAENIRAKSVEMFKKEFYTSVVAYNLVAQFRRQAAKLAQLPPRRLRFKGVWTTLKDRLLTQPACGMAEWITRYDDALRRAAKKKHPNRSHPRTYPRKAHTRRQKSTKFVKTQRKNTNADGDPHTPSE
jgi:hypothetical protein